MPRVLRVMRKSEDGLPTVEQTASGLGVRRGIDVDVDHHDQVVMNGKGMSVAPSWRDIDIRRIPKRLRDMVPGARGSNATFCFRFGAGPFVDGQLAQGLYLVVDSTTHGCVTPTESVALGNYEHDLAATRPGWELDET